VEIGYIIIYISEKLEMGLHGAEKLFTYGA
jgi:hypothetical protein